MQRLSERYRRWLRLRAENEKKRRRISGDSQSRLRSSIRLSIRVPETLCFDHAAEATLSLFAQIRAAILDPVARRPIFLDFNGCNSLSPASAVVLAAEVHRGAAISFKGFRGKLVHGNYPKNKDVRNVLTDVGFFEHVGIVPRASDDHRSGHYFLRVTSNTRDKGDLIAHLCEAALQSTGPMPANFQGRLYAALSEAMNNVTQHAYLIDEQRRIGPRRPCLLGRWWAAAYSDRQSGLFTLWMFDQGVGIPATLPIRRPSLWAAIMQSIQGNADDDAILIEALKPGTSQTKSPHRGKGLAEMQRFVSEVCSIGTIFGHFSVLSNHGGIKLSNGLEPERRLFRCSLDGTLIELQFRLPTEEPGRLDSDCTD
jgi:hypothetical protein